MKRDDTMPNGYVPGAVEISPHDAALIARRDAALGPAYRLFYENPVHLVRGEGVWLYDAEGNAYLDTYNNVASVGHCHPHVIAATAHQSAILSSHTRYLHDGVLDYAEGLLATFPAPLAHVMFTCTGSEANDLALRIARAHTGGTGVIVTENAYHGVTMEVSGMSPSFGKGVPLGAHVRTVAAPDPHAGADVAARFTADVQAAIDDLLRHGIQPAALLVDTVFSSDGVFTEPKGFLKGAVAAIRAAGGIFIADEVQPGFGRLGETMWGFARHDVIPDMASLGKPMGNGYPIAGLVMQPRVIAEFAAKARYFNTFGGNATAAATAMAVLEVVQNEALQANALHVGQYFRDQLRSLAADDEGLGDIRGAGLFIGAEMVSDRAKMTADSARTSRIVNGMREKRVLISSSGPRGNVLKIRPPLVFSRQNVDLFIERLQEVLRSTR